VRHAIRAAPTLATAVSVVAALAAGLPGAAAPAAAATTTYTITGLGPPGGSNPSAINATGEMTGYWYLATLMPAPSCPPAYGNTNKPAGNTPGKPCTATAR
jgi:hypothetical protein